jgi:hypothetical protein
MTIRLSNLSWVGTDACVAKNLGRFNSMPISADASFYAITFLPMNRLHRDFLLALGLLTSLCAPAQELPLGVLAAQMPRAAAAAVGFRDEGKPKEFLTKALPEKSAQQNRTGREMHQIADDVYAFPEMKGLTYFTYTQERFSRELRGQSAPARFEQVAAPALACQATATGDDWTALQVCMQRGGQSNCLEQAKWQQLIQCVGKVVRDYSPEQQLPK